MLFILFLLVTAPFVSCFKKETLSSRFLCIHSPPFELSARSHNQKLQSWQSTPSKLVSTESNVNLTLLLRPLSVSLGFCSVLWGTRGRLAIPMIDSLLPAVSFPILQHCHPYRTPITMVALTTFLASLIIPTYAPSVYCGCFAALTSPALLTSSCDIWSLLGLTIAFHEIWERQSILRGYGGRLGTTAVLSGTILQLYKQFKSLFGATSSAAAATTGGGVAVKASLTLLVSQILSSLNNAIQFTTLSTESVLQTALVICTSAVLTGYLRIQDQLTPVHASSTVVLASSLSYTHHLLQQGKWAKLLPVNSPALLLMGSFFGMSTFLPYFNAQSFLSNMAVQSLLSVFVLHVVEGTLIGQVGGKLGMAALASILLVHKKTLL